jgi:uncharacterized membrane protein
MSDTVMISIEYTAYLLESIAAIIIVIGAVQAVWLFIKRAVIGKSSLKEITA